MNIPKLAVSLLKLLTFIGRKGTCRGFEAQYKGTPDYDPVGRHGVLRLLAQEGRACHFAHHALFIFIHSSPGGRQIFSQL